MKTAIVLGILIGLSPMAMAQSASTTDFTLRPTENGETPAETSVSFAYFFSSHQYSGFYEKMYGIEIQHTWWNKSPFGVSVMTGLMDAEVRTTNGQLVDPAEGYFTGSATLIPVGVSGLYDIYESDNWGLFAEAGLRYVFVSSDIQIQSVDTGASENIGQDNAPVAILRVHLDRKISDRVFLFGSLGAQWDLSAGKITSKAGVLGDDNLKGNSVTVGARFLF